MGNGLQSGLAQNFPGALVFCQHIVEGDFLVSEAGFFTPRMSCPNIPRQLDELLGFGPESVA